MNPLLRRLSRLSALCWTMLRAGNAMRNSCRTQIVRENPNLISKWYFVPVLRGSYVDKNLKQGNHVETFC